MISAVNANYVTPPLSEKYADPHVIAGVLKKYLRSLPDPLLTFDFYPDFVAAAQKQSEAQRKAAILNIINQLPTENYDNLRYLTKFLSYLSEKNQENKMSPQNIAIVMSPNLLWSPNENENYIDQVNSTATVNTIVEALIADWGFFFDGDVNFYVSMTRDTLFPDNGGFPVDKDLPVRYVPNEMMSKSMFASTTTGSQDEVRYYNSGGGGSGGGGGGGTYNNSQKASTSHSRSSSHDTSLILINSNDQLNKHRSQSNSSLSDHSSPPHESSPKPTVRRKHNKQAAPTPPDSHHKNSTGSNSSSNSRELNNKLQSTSYFKQLNHNDHHRDREDEGFQSLQHHAYKQAQQEYASDRQTMIRAESHDNLLKLKSPSSTAVAAAVASIGDKMPPPRPAAVSIGDSQTLNRSKGQNNLHQQHHQNSKQPNAPNCDTTSSIG